jgi:putative nucleotidyltransferase with HDIG domain
VNLREELERESGSVAVTRRRSASALVLVVLAALGIALLAAAALSRGGARPPASFAGAFAGAFATSCLLAGGMALLLRLFRPQLFADRAAIGLLVSLVAVVLAAAAVGARLRPGAPQLVPIALLGIVASALFDRPLAVVAVLLTAALLASQPAFDQPGALSVLLVAGGAAALCVRPASHRDQSYLWMIIVAAATACVVAAASLAAGLPTDVLWRAAVQGAATSAASVVGAMLLMPIAERLTGRETHLTLLEWGDLNRPLLQRLSLEAPGTYAHTIAIANLAEAAARAVGANALLARVGAYYHDIGKLAKPQYFVENQPRGRNLHDKLKPHTSASIIRNHIREGVELAIAERVPRSIRAFITEHHGTGTIAYFLERAREREGVVGNPAEFTYPGPVPQSAETAIVMLADGAEAATRAIADPTPERIRDVIDRVVQQRLEQGQLRDAPLTLRQLTVVKREFARVLGGMYHARLDYPTPAVPTEVVR